MKQSAAKTLGVAALGAAFAAAAAGTASAAPAVLPAPAPSLDTVTSVLPAQEALTHALPTGQQADPVSTLLGGLPTDGLPIGDVGILPVGDGLPGLG
ncbi:ATP-binding protein [Streptomyces sp. CA-135486]|uniref:ATP-binding protein n=1 Tax=Streptomyces sp. CA-135486 TaxID=3240049 RepID=UPI003D8EFBCD